MKFTVNREHGNAGDVLVSFDGSEPFHVPGDVTSFTALRMLAPWLEAELEKRAKIVAAAEATHRSSNEMRAQQQAQFANSSFAAQMSARASRGDQ